ncbi:redoxin domain-containing protein [Reinekea marina]|uniref:Peroxiredoxin family protein n=1 Tax=Reinekea marina TaxID=1310421 RepID=A0ABV7WWX2_9GAMM|nr:redoxin domain-containing protein [Reinekea marina]MBU2862628.1 redoxin domain-containing protein [Reinekea forsetii]MDN3648856.1 redoxin domain-containing protein [Reinekea marina]
MRLSPPCPSIDFSTTDVFGKPIQLSDYQGKKVMLAFFRDAACPFCNLRVYELTHKYKVWQDSNLEIIAVFSSPADEVRKYVAKHPRPFKLVSDADLDIYNRYGVEHSTSALFKALFFKLPRIIKGMIKGGYPQPNPHVKLVPADFLIGKTGKIEQVWYGKDTSDHMPIEQVERFVAS